MATTTTVTTTTEDPSAGEVRLYPVTQPDNSIRHQLILVTHVDEDGRASGVPVGWDDAQASFAPGTLV